MNYVLNGQHFLASRDKLREIADEAEADGVSLEDFCGGVAEGLRSLLEIRSEGAESLRAEALTLAMINLLAGIPDEHSDGFDGNAKRLH